MAMGSLLKEGYNTRIIGEDSERGTFNHRNAVFTDQKI
jgi:2-oxoglutarate dehydrogenase E1 component